MQEERGIKAFPSSARSVPAGLVRNFQAGAVGTALFIDIENVIGHCATLGLPVRLRPICEKMKEFAPLRARKAFGDIAKTINSTGNASGIVLLRRELAANLVEIQDIPYLTLQKNSADIHIVVAALSLAYENPHLSHFAFVATDRDYVPLYSKLKEYGKTVVVMGINESFTSGVVAEAADYLYFYEQLPEIAVLLKTGQAFEEEDGEARLEHPGAQAARDPFVFAASSPSWGMDDYCQAYRQALEVVLKSPFPSPADRKAILEAAGDAFAPEMLLSEWTNKTAQRFREENGSSSTTVNDRMIYKLLLSLYFSRAVRAQQPQEDRANPRILEFACPAGQMGEYLERNYISTIIRKTPYELRPEALAKLLYEDISAEALSRCAQYISELSYLLPGRPLAEEAVC